MKRKNAILKRIFSLVLVSVMAFSGIVSAYGSYYQQANPQAVNQGLSSAQIESNDLSSFSEKSGYDYHDASPDDYAPNEIILEVISSADNTTSSLSSFSDDYGLSVQRVLKTEQADTSEDYSTLSSVDNSGSPTVITSYFMKTQSDDIISLCDKLNKNAEVFNAQPNFKYEICDDNTVNMSQDSSASFTAPNAFSTTEYTNNLKWWFDYCNISTAWENYADSSTGYGMGKGITVAVIDTGCNTNHEDIVNNLWSYPSDTTKCGYYAYGSSFISKNDSSVDVNGHGSHCCGTIAMSGDNSVGGIGTAPKCNVMVMKADRNTGQGSFYDSELITSLEKASSLGADIISLSLGGYEFSYSTYRTYQKVSSSCLIVCAAGNNSFDTSEKVFFPAAASCNIGVMALNTSSGKNKLAYFSNYDTSGQFYKVVAPGTDIYSLDYSSDNGYCTKNGTSMATPATAGMIASYMSYIKYVKGWDWTPAQYQYKIESIINSTSNTLTAAAYNKSYHPVAYTKDSKFKVMNLNALCSGSLSNSFSSVSAVTFSNSTVLAGVKNSTGLSASELDTYALKRVSLLYWTLSSTAQGISDYSDFSKLTGLNYLDLSGAKNVNQSNLSTVTGYLSPTLLYLDLRPSTDLTDISCLAETQFSNLYYLDISDNALTNIGAIEKFTSLKYLYADNNSITDITALSGMTHLDKADLSNNTIQDATPAFSSKFLYNINLSHNNISDYNQLYNYKGAYVSSTFKSDTITLNVSYNNMTLLTSTIASDIKSTIETNNTNNGTLYATTINFTYTNQTAASYTPMTSYTLSNQTVTREAFCNGNLNTSALTGFKAYPSGANQYNYLSWKCDEEGYCNTDGTVSLSPSQITSTRTLTFTGTAQSASSALSTVSGTASQTIKITITAPEIYNAYLADRVIKTSSSSYIMVSISPYTSKLVLRSGTSASATDYTVYDLSSALNVASVANDMCKIYFLSLPTSVTSASGTYPLYLYAADSSGNYSVGSSCDISGRTTYAYRALGSLYVNDSPDTSATLNITAPTSICRCGEGAIFASNAGISSTSPAKTSGTYALTMSGNKYIGSGTVYTSFGAGYAGRTYTGYPSATVGSGSLTLKLTDSSSNETTASASISTLAPEVNAVSCNNATTYSADGYTEYLVKTNNDASGIKTVTPATTTAVESESELIMSAHSSSVAYAVYNSGNSYKLWKLRVPLSSSAPQPVTIIAYDSSGDGSVTKTPATGVDTGSNLSIYPDTANLAKSLYSGLTFSPLDESGNSLADCCKSVVYSMASTDYFTLTSTSLGRVTCDMASFVNKSSSYTTYTRVNVTATLENGTSDSAYIYGYKPALSEFKYDADKSNLAPGGTVYYSVKTYGADTITISPTSSADDKIQTLTLSDTANYTKYTDDNGDKYIIWNFTRNFDSSGTRLMTYVRASYAVSDSVTANSASYTSLSATSVGTGDYSLWDAQTARLSESALTALKTAYGSDTASYDAYLADINTFRENAVMNYSVSHQAEIDEQTNTISAMIDTLFGYDAFNTAVSDYNSKISENPDYYFIPDALTALINTTVDDSNAKADAVLIEQYLLNLEAKAHTSAWLAALASVPENMGKVFSWNGGYAVYTSDSVEAVKAAETLPFELPLPASRQSEIDSAVQQLSAAIADLDNNIIDVTELQNDINNEVKYTSITETCTLPDNLATNYAAKLSEIKSKITTLNSEAEAKILASSLSLITDKIDEFYSELTALTDYLADITKSDAVPALTTQGSTNEDYSDATYTPLKQKYDEIISKLADKNAGLTTLESIKDALNQITVLYNQLHKHNFNIPIGETCEYKYMKCSCGEYRKVAYTQSEAAEHSHSWGATISVNAPLCDSSTHFSYKVCSVCGAVKIVDNEEMLTSTEHNWVLKDTSSLPETLAMLSEGVNSVKPTCTTNGSNVYVCTKCGAFYTEDVAPLDHDYSDGWIITKQPTETEEGSMKCVCKRCGDTIVESIPCLGARGNLTIPFESSVYSAEGITLKAYIHGADLSTDAPDYTFSENADKYGYKVSVNQENHTLTVRLPLNTVYDIVIEKKGCLSFTLYNAAIADGDRDITVFNKNHPEKAVTLNLLSGDTNGDNSINALDKIELKNNMGAEISDENKFLDLNADGVIDSLDRSLLLVNYMSLSSAYTFASTNVAADSDNDVGDIY